MPLRATIRAGNHSGDLGRLIRDAQPAREVEVQEPDGFREFVAARSPALQRAAWLLTGNRDTAQDLVQTALARTWTRWHRLEHTENAEAYVRRVMVTTYATWWRRRWRGEVPTASMPDSAETTDSYAEADLRDAIRTALTSLPRRQRAVIVLRYFEDLTEAQTAAALGCSVGTVKSQSSKALARLRTHDWLRPDQPREPPAQPTQSQPARTEEEASR